ncbi:MAG: DNA adenine methylase [Deltaproteobacteria bacterium]|nr:DNA adenine methylase [Deltaproteobacteria bacterium]
MNVHYKNLQQSLFSSTVMASAKIVNVASVPQRSPFRYPGGKTWLIPEIRAWLRSLPRKPEIFIEPFAGGGIASLTAAFENLADHVFMIEKDDQVAAVWDVILKDADWLADKILSFNLTLENTLQVLSTPPHNLREKAFQVILRNRVQRGGIMAPGASLLKFGENGRGIASRWYPQTLAKRIKAIYEHRNRIMFKEADAFDFIPHFLNNPHAAFFIDPPYTAGGKRAGKRLYLYSEIDHDELFSMMAEAKGNFMMTYDDTEEVKELSFRHGFSIRRVPMKSTHHSKMYELLIGPTSISKQSADLFF